MIEPWILGRGAASRALRMALAFYPEDVAPPRTLERTAKLPEPDPESTLLVLANPHGLHAPRLLEAAAAGCRWAICEKPAAVSLEQVEALEGLPVATWICHGYRLLWGPGALRDAVAAGRLGAVVSVEGRYWQSSATEPAPRGWKDDPAISGEFDVLLDLATHWADLVGFVLGGEPDRVEVRRFFVNAASPHRDTHVHLTMGFGEVATFGSVSKAAHGAGNTLELVVIGERASAAWSFGRPDEIVWGEGRERRVEVRREMAPPARLAPFHGLGWLEGYARLVGEVVQQMRRGENGGDAARLPEHLDVVRRLLIAAGA